MGASRITSPTSAKFLQLVADPHRWSLLHHLARSDRRVGELSELLGRPQNLVSYHLRELRSNGLISARRSSADGRDTYYRIELRHCRTLFAEAGSALHPGLRLAPAADDARTLPGSATVEVLFLCTGNSSRSQIAEALLERRSGNTVSVRSAGSAPKPLHPHAVDVMSARGIDISGRHTKHVDRFADLRFDHVITLCDKVREICPEFPGHPATAHWSIPDPATASADSGDPLAPFNDVADEIDERVDFLISQIAADAAGTTRPQRTQGASHDPR
jgi:protein-tyrosine-phosphatase/DNA-binding transcriptional ArsR family regulator